MKHFISNIYHNTRLGFALIHPLSKVYEYFRFAFVSDEKFINKEFEKNLAFKPNLGYAVPQLKVLFAEMKKLSCCRWK